MKFAFCLLLVLQIGCKIHETPDKNQPDTFSEQNSNVKRDVVQTVFELGKAKIKGIFQAFDPPSAFCKAVLHDSPTREDYIRNWQPHDEVNFCPGGAPILESCQKKHNDAFEAGLLCYKNNILSVGN